MSNISTQYDHFNPALVIFIGAQVIPIAIANVFWLIPTSQIAVFWYPSAFNPIRVYDLKTHTDFGKKNVHITE